MRKISKIFHFSQMKSFFCLIFCDVTQMLYKTKQLRKCVLVSIFFSKTNHSTIDSQKFIYPLTIDYTSYCNVLLKGYQLLLFTNHFLFRFSMFITWKNRRCQEKSGNVLLFNETTLSKCKFVLSIRKIKELKYSSIALPESIETDIQVII